ncbi:hypothetical protein N802_06155 [Knoellia sinensis KCTC 19936]|uniref:Adenosylmethionine-8-amino-7-oxononanoate aminotransferase n=1 Tax=Knoellia sinensis KCTC 19936 TaxID=1385520 RepID=A0A0A0J110_9MICO|nr:adenosylmethionine--8-amino-7-oxononanoate transaminase [Knoellia sinensis]KGN30788.1 hypothetical protein N802_06155 [Knoellia sinensis KCTC 19936]
MPDATLLRSDTRLIGRERGLVWHPYAPLTSPALFQVDAAEGVRLTLTDADGTSHEVIDGMSSWWSTIHGYRHPELDRALAEQSGRFSHVMFGGLTHEPAVALAERLVALTPPELQHVFLADSGSVSVEVALKLAVQYQAARGRPGRRRFVALRGGYHGDTAGAMSVCDPVDGMHATFAGHVSEQIFLPRMPSARLVDGALVSDADAVANWCATAEVTIAHHADEVAGIIVEPVLQGAGGMYVYAPECLTFLRAVADAHGLLLICDEIATGFGRTGRMFAGEWADVVPDILCVGKALTGGYLTLAAMICSTKVAAALEGTPQAALLHGPTFMGNPLACAVAAASLSLVERDGLDRVERIRLALTTSLLGDAADACGVPRPSSVRDIRVLGAVGVVELDRPVDVPGVTAAAVRHGVWLRPFRNLVYAMPPYVSTDDVRTIGHAMLQAVAEVHG